ncbi:Uncharacterized conserved protein, DUF2267 family [Devosia lucknowensis]|uniref:Uncharacterized conserved protein, DUF2267 family n=1 Tax=Devosia lucknowensis TaxID=1096929 RepID=A0A1Y6EBL1_9HYPH|nr:DUF2267 domain-containing protein [Devosia lucknowensis]SMQ58002.1 Uncharacterized conserved protein, DUF2267 family [Devosia lucknowensis]
MTNPRDVKYANQSIARWQDALKQRALLETNNIAFACLRGFLHEIRARLSVDDIARFGNRLPAVQRGVFYQDWLPAPPVPCVSLGEFETALAQRLLPHIHMPENISGDVLWVIKTESEPFEAAQLRKVLPYPLQDLWDGL